MPRAALVLSLLIAITGTARADFQALLAAARTGDTAAVLDMIAAGEAADPPGFHHGYSPLQFTARRGDVEAVGALLAAGADTEYRDHNGDRALLWAARGANAEATRLLLEAGSPPDSEADPYGRTPLMEASYVGDEATVALLLEHGADPHRFDQGAETALYYAAWGGNTAVARMLLAHGAHPGVIGDILFRTPLHMAASYGSPDLIAMLLADGPADSRDLDGNTPLMMATLSRSDANVAALLDGRARPNIANDAGLTPLLVAVRDGQVEIVRLLLAVGADVETVDASGQGVQDYLTWHPVAVELPEGSRAASIGRGPDAAELARLDAAHAEIATLLAAR